jgi:hypothetical protein
MKPLGTFEIISSLSFNEYVLIDCFKSDFTNVEFRYCLYFNQLNFVAYTKQGFWNIFNELKTLLVDFKIALLKDQIRFFLSNLFVTIRYTELNFKNMTHPKDIREHVLNKLINLPGLDFYKCYYDGVKIHSTPEAIQCHKTGEVQYVGPINLDYVTFINLRTYKSLKFKDKLWEVNKEHFLNLRKQMFSSFETVLSDIPRSFEEEEKMFSGQWHTIYFKSCTFEHYEKRICKIVEEFIFNNPISTLS